MPDARSPQEQPGCRSILIRLIFRSGNAEQYRAWMARRPLRLVVTFTHAKKQYEREAARGDEGNTFYE
jgi:hypothetical protein